MSAPIRKSTDSHSEVRHGFSASRSARRVFSPEKGRWARSFSLLALAGAAVAGAFGPRPVMAATYTWTGAVNAQWNNAGNWVGGVSPTSTTDDIVDFGSLDLSAAATLNLNNTTSTANRTAGTFIFGDTGETYYGWTVNAAQSGNPAQTQKLILAVSSGTGTIQVNNATTTINAIVAGVSGLTKTGGGTLVLTNDANTISGGIFLNAGLLRFDSAGALAGNGVTFTGTSTLRWGTGVTTDVSVTGTGLKLNDGVTATLDTNGNDVTLSAAFQTGVSANAAVIKAGAGVLTLTGQNTYTGGTSLRNGSLILAGGGDNRLAAGGLLTIGNGTNTNVTVQLGDASGPSNQTVSGLAVAGTGTNFIKGGNAAISTLTVNNGVARTYSGTLGSGVPGATGVEENLALVKTGSAALTLSGLSNSFVGNVTIGGGALIVQNSNSLGSGTKTVTISGVTNAPSLQLNSTSGGLSFGAGISYVTSNSNATAPAILNVAGDNVIGGSIALASGGFGTGDTRIRVNAGTLTLNGAIAPDATAVSARTLLLDGAGSGTVNGTISDQGSIGLSVVKEGAGTWTLSAANSYSGTTTVSAGRLNVSTAQTGTGAITVADSAALGVTLTAVGESLAPAALTLGAVTGTTLHLNLGAFPNPTAPVIDTTAFSASGTNTINIAGTGLSVGVFDLISYQGSIGGGGYSALVLGSLPARVSAALVDGIGVVQLDVTAFDLPKWTGAAGNNLWDINDGPDPTTGTGSINWEEVNSHTATRYLQTGSAVDSVLFDDSAPTAAKNVILGATLTPNTLTVNNSGDDYTFSGAGALSGATVLTKQGTAKLILVNTGTNAFTGGATISAGTVQIGDGATVGGGAGGLGSGPVSVAAGAALVFNQPSGSDLVAANVVSGAGALSQIGQNVLTLSGNNASFSGSIVVSAGTLKVGNANALGDTLTGTTVAAGATLELAGLNIAEPVTLTGGKLSGSTGASVLGGGLTLTGGGLIEVAGTSLTLSGAIGGSGGLVKTGAGTLILSGSSSFADGLTNNAGNLTLSGTQAFSGGLASNAGTVLITADQSYTGGTTITQGTLQIGVNTAATSGSLGAGDIALNPVAATTATLSILRGDSALEIANRITSSGAGTNAVSIGGGGAGSLSGTVTFSGDNTFTGDVTILGGALRITNSNALGVGTKTINVQNASHPALLLDGSSSDLTLAAGISFKVSSDGASSAATNNPGGIVNLAGDNTIEGSIAVTNGGGGNGKIVVLGGSLTLAGTIDAAGATGGRSLLLGGTAQGFVTGAISDWFDTVASTTRVVSVTKSDSGTWTLSGLNSFTGAVAVQEGTLSFDYVDTNGSSQPLGAASSAVTLGTTTTAATLEYTGDSAFFYRPINVTANGPGATLKNTGGGELTLAGVIAKNATKLTFGGGDFDVLGGITSTGATAEVIVAADTVTFSIGNTYTGATRVNGGATLKLGIENALPATTVLTLGEATGNTGGTLDLHGYNQTIAGLAAAGTGPVVVTNESDTDPATLTVAGAGTFRGTIQDGAEAATGFTKGGTGTFTLTGSNPFTGPTEVTGGILVIAGGLTGTTSLKATGAALQLGASDVLNDAAPLLLDSGFLLTAGFSEGTLAAAGLGTLTILGESGIDFGVGNSLLHFTGIEIPAGTLAITNWDAGADRLIFSGNETARLAFEGEFAQEAVSFNGVAGYSAIQIDAVTFEIIAVPEPGAAALFGAAALLGLSTRRVRSRQRPPASAL